MGTILLLLCIIGMTAVSCYLNSTAFRRMLLERLNTVMAGTLAVGHHRLSLVSGKITFSDVVLTGADGTSLAAVDRLQASLFWPALAWRQIRISRLYLEMPELQLVFDHQDRLPLLQAFSASRESSAVQTAQKPWQVRIDDLGLKLGVMHVQRPARRWTATARQIGITGRADLLKTAGRVRTVVDYLTWQGPGGSNPSVEDLTLTASYAPSKVQPLRLEIKTADSAFSIQGAVDWQSPLPQLDLRYCIDLDLAPVQAYLPADWALTGRAQGRGIVKGPVDDPDGHLHLEIADGRMGAIPLDKLRLDLKLARRKVTLADLQVRSKWGDVDMTAAIDLQPMFARNWREATAGLESPVYDFRLTGRNLQPGRWPQVAFPLRYGKWQVSANVAGRGVIGPQSAGRANVTLGITGAKSTAASRAADGRLAAELLWGQQVLEIKKFTAAAGPNRFKARGRIDLAARQMDVQGRLDIVRMDALGAILDVTAPTGQGQLTLHGHGAVTAPTIRASLLAREIAWKDWTIGRVLVESELAPNGVLAFSRLALENQGSSVEGRGTLALLQADNSFRPDPAIALALEFDQLEPNDFNAFEPFQGHFNGRLDLGGTLQHLSADLDLAQSPLRWHDLACRAQGKARWEDGRLTIADLRLFKNTSSLHLQGWASWRDPLNGQWMAAPVVQARLRSQTLRLQDLRDGWTGGVNLQARVAGPVSNLQGRFSLQSGHLDLGIQKLHGLKSTGRLIEHRLQIDRLRVEVAAGQNITAQGWYGFDQRYAFLLEGAGIDLKHITSLQRAYPLRGLLNLHLSGSGSLSHPHLAGDLEVRQPRFKDQPWDDLRIQLRVRENLFDLDADLNFALKCGGRLDSGDFNLRAVFDRSDLSPYLALGFDSRWSGHLSGTLQAAGNWHAPLQARLTAALTAVQLSYQRIPFVRADNLNIDLQNGVLKMPVTRIAVMGAGHLTLQASGAIQGQLDVQADGRLPLAALAPVSRMLTDADGEFEIRFRAQGPARKIQWGAELDLSDVGMTIPGLSPSIRDLNGRLVINSRMLIVDSLAGAMDSGRFSLDGEVRLAALRPVRGRLDFSARSLPLQWPAVMDVVLNGDLSLYGNPREAVLAGRLDLIEGTYYKNVRLNLLSGVTRPRRRQSVPGTGVLPKWMQAIGLDITVGHRNPLLVANNLVNLQVAPDFRLIGTLARPVLNGRAEVTDGEVIYRRKSFAIKRGVVDFINPYEMEPHLDILSAARIRKWRVSLAVSGTPDQLQLKLSSEPPEADNDILALILLGRTNRELTGGKAVDTRTTAQMLATLMAAAWGEDVKKTTGMDILELETGAEDGSGGQDRTQVTLGKKLSRRLTVKYALASDNGDMVQKAISEYRFREHLLASGFQDSGGDYGAELLLRIEFQ